MVWFSLLNGSQQLLAHSAEFHFKDGTDIFLTQGQQQHIEINAHFAFTLSHRQILPWILKDPSPWSVRVT